MVAVTAMHEHVHEGASEQREPDEYSKDVGAVLGKQECAANDQKPDENKARRRRQKTALRTVLVFRMIVQGHRRPPTRQ
jgi:hypothetical protein